MKVEASLNQLIPDGYFLYCYTGYPSKHIADNALCRWFDEGSVGFDEWMGAKIIKWSDKYYITLKEIE